MYTVFICKIFIILIEDIYQEIIHDNGKYSVDEWEEIDGAPDESTPTWTGGSIQEPGSLDLLKKEWDA